MKCRYCINCNPSKRANTTGNNSHGEPRISYYCTNPKTKNLPDKAFGNKDRAFISFGTVELGSPIAMKTSPRWCPLKGL